MNPILLFYTFSILEIISPLFQNREFFEGNQNVNIELMTNEGKSNKFVQIENNGASVFVFLSPECPLCINYTLTLNQLFQKFKDRRVVFYGVFPGKYYSKKKINRFVKKYDLKFNIVLDPDYGLTKKYNATVTPEAVFIGSNGLKLYSGKIDNWAYELGKKRTVITEHYLEDSIDSYLNGKEIKIKITEPVGCFIFALPEKNP